MKRFATSLFSAAVDRGLSAKTQVVGVSDGGNGLRAGLDAVCSNMRFVLDKYHFKKHVFEAADEIGLKGADRETWVSQVVQECERGDAEKAVKRLRDYHESRPDDAAEGEIPPGEKRVHQLAGYINKFKDAVDYDKVRAQGYPCGSGEVESAQKYIPQERLKIPGACWSPETINPRLALRVLRENGWWPDYWQTRAQPSRGS